MSDQRGISWCVMCADISQNLDLIDFAGEQWKTHIANTSYDPKMVPTDRKFWVSDTALHHDYSSIVLNASPTTIIITKPIEI